MVPAAEEEPSPWDNDDVIHGLFDDESGGIGLLEEKARTGWWRRRRHGHHIHHTHEIRMDRSITPGDIVAGPFPKLAKELSDFENKLAKINTEVQNKIQDRAQEVVKTYSPMFTGILSNSEKNVKEINRYRDESAQLAATAKASLDSTMKLVAQAQSEQQTTDQLLGSLQEEATRAIDTSNEALAKGEIFRNKAIEMLKISGQAAADGHAASEAAEEAWKQTKQISIETMDTQIQSKNALKQADDSLMESQSAINELQGAIKSGKKAMDESDQALEQATSATGVAGKIKFITTALQSQQQVDDIMQTAVNASQAAIDSHGKATKASLKALAEQDKITEQTLAQLEGVRVIHGDNLRRTDKAIEAVEILNEARDSGVAAMVAQGEALDAAMRAQGAMNRAIGMNMTEGLRQRAEDLMEVNNLLQEVRHSMEDKREEIDEIQSNIDRAAEFDPFSDKNAAVLVSWMGTSSCLIVIGTA